MISLANALLPSSRAALAVGPKQAIPRSRTASAAPATRGASGPTTTRSTFSSAARAAIPSPSSKPCGSSRHNAIASMPGSPVTQDSIAAEIAVEQKLVDRVYEELAKATERASMVEAEGLARGRTDRTGDIRDEEITGLFE